MLQARAVIQCHHRGLVGRRVVITEFTVRNSARGVRWFDFEHRAGRNSLPVRNLRGDRADKQVLEQGSAIARHRRQPAAPNLPCRRGAL